MSKHEQMFGCDPDAFLGDLEGPISRSGLGMVLMSLLSDVQEQMAVSDIEGARKAINRVKYLVHASLPMHPGVVAPLPVTEALNRLRQLHAETTPGTWHKLPGRALVISGEVSDAGYQGFDVLRGHAPDARSAKRNAEFSATMHNLAPAVFEAIELAVDVGKTQETLPADQRDVSLHARAEKVLAAVSQALV